jgi:hypothetical protein
MLRYVTYLIIHNATSSTMYALGITPGDPNDWQTFLVCLFEQDLKVERGGAYNRYVLSYCESTPHKG